MYQTHQTRPTLQLHSSSPSLNLLESLYKMQTTVSDPDPKPASDQVVLSIQPPPPPSSPKPRPTLTRLPVSKPKSRYLELNYSPRLPPKPAPETPEPDSDSDSDFSDFEAHHPISDKFHPKNQRLIGPRAAIESIALIALTALLTATLTIPFLKRREIVGLKLWEWAVMLLVVFCGRLIANWLVWIFVFFLEKNFPLKEKVLYFVFGLRRSVRSCVWLALVLLVWFLLFDRRRNRVENSSAIHRISLGLIAVLIAATIWMLKILLVKVFASSFHVATFFDRMKESVFHHYILETLSGDPIGEDEKEPVRECHVDRRIGRRVAREKTMPARAASRRIDIERLRRLSTARATTHSLKKLMSHVMRTGLSTVSRTVDRVGEQFGEAEADITSEWEARCSAERIFKHVARPGNKYIEEEDLRRFLNEEEVNTIFPLFEGAIETGKIKKSAFRSWVVVRAYRERKSLAHALNDTKTAVQQLHKLASGVVSVIIIIVTLLVMGVASTKVFVAITSQLLLVGFLFQNTGKTIFESIVFVFVVHPFDSGDRCVIDGVQLIVEEMNILSTVFLRYDNEKIYYPNSVLLTKPISNFHRSPDMQDTIEFSIDVSTDVETVGLLRKSIQTYLESKPKYWHPKHSVLVKEIENVNKMKMALTVLHTMNHQNFPERSSRRSELVFELKKIFESLGIKYHLLPQEVHLTQLVMTEGRIPPPISGLTHF